MHHPVLSTTLFALGLTFVTSAEALAAGSLLPPWVQNGQWPSSTRSVQVLEGEQALHFAPNTKSPRRGSATLGALLPLFGQRPGPGCRNNWLHVGPQAWLCQDKAAYSNSPALPFVSKGASTNDGMPYRYFFVGPDGALTYRLLEEVDVGIPSATLDAGFAVAIFQQHSIQGQRYGRTLQGQWLAMRTLRPARPSNFQGEVVSTPELQQLPFAWVFTPRAPQYVRRGSRFVAKGPRIARLTRVGYLEEARVNNRKYVRINESRWVRARDIRHPTLSFSPPTEVSIPQNEHWIDIDLSTQTLVAYEGRHPVFATLVSTGKGKTPNHPFVTPKGTHRIWVKLLTSVMDNLENDAASNYYRLEDVPYVQYFSKGVGLHTAFWHNSFGRVRSHGCVNLAPRDAQFLFWWTRPHLPNGWSAALPTRYEQGTVIRVR